MRPRLLLVTDLDYPAAGRPEYRDEDLGLAARLRADFDVALCHPVDASALMAGFDLVLVRNSGPVLRYVDQYAQFRREALAAGAKVFTELSGKADMAGKQYLLDLTEAGFPVIPTVDRAQDAHRLPESAEYVVKPKLGADSVGLRFLPRTELPDGTDHLIQPRIDFAYEVSFYYVDQTYCYALHTPDPALRWDLAPYTPTDADLAFARRFVTWNAVAHGIQRVDACRTREGELLLVELEDLNPYLSLDRVSPATRETFVAALTDSLLRMLD
ncbi:hypothetical protein [Actinophytocola oryzae]|uniref:ATP-grasp domain-containing protein n=1 Tax=Actinophytocola oryzae TaxID=502181 RepID=A0A4R7W3V6_9PSEU|nr:hypothetical protein [Actinophytocola oryzae]TDV57353.1 hypothetical protein CLV71_101224 [Actinophytocola oryzae]